MLDKFLTEAKLIPVVEEEVSGLLIAWIQGLQDSFCDQWVLYPKSVQRPVLVSCGVAAAVEGQQRRR